MEPNNTYKYLSVILAITTIAFAAMYFIKPEPKISETISEISTDFQECSNKIRMWRQANVGVVTDEARAELDGILELCTKTTEDSQDKI